MLPIERERQLEGRTATHEDIKKEQEEIHRKIVTRNSDEIEQDEAAMTLVGYL
jgi:hypothetical protein